jgi:hypothetical protein
MKQGEILWLRKEQLKKQLVNLLKDLLLKKHVNLQLEEVQKEQQLVSS